MAMTPAERNRQSEIAEQLLKNKLLSSKNFLNYSGLTYEDIVTEINSRLSAERDFDNFRESAVAQIILEIFAGVADMVNHYIERRAEESFFDTAKLKSSLILLARSLAYDIKRPIPAQTQIKITLKGNLDSGTYSAGDVIQIPQYSNFTVEGNNYLLLKQFNYTLSAEDFDNGSDWKKDIYFNQVSEGEDDKIKLIQGERKIYKIEGNGNAKVNQIFQQYRIPDTTFSNIYGSQDLVGPLTQVGIGDALDTAFPDGVSQWEIDRRTLLRQDSIETYDFTSTVNEAKKICLIRTATDEGVELLFGDDKYVSKGLKKTTDNIYIKYLSTIGANANLVGVIGKKVTLNDTVTLNGQNLAANLESNLTTNIQQGANIESNDSIKINAPGIYYTLDRLVTKEDYKNFLKSLSTPIPIKNALAWGEQEEVKLGQMHYGERRTAIKKLFNVVLFSVIGSIYNTDSTLAEFSPKNDLSTENSVLDSDYNIDEINSQSYFNVFTVNSSSGCDCETGGKILEEVRNQQTIAQGDSKINNFLVANGGEQDSTKDDWIGWKTYRETKETILYYTSAENVSAKDNENVLSAGFTIIPGNHTSFDNLCTWITETVRDLNLFPDDITFYWDDIYKKFNVKHQQISGSNYLVDVYDYCSGLLLERSDAPFSNTGNIDGRWKTINFTNTQIGYSENISTVLKEINKRNQITVKPVYISPTVQKFNIDGKIYVNSLVNKDSLHTQIKNKIYSWLDEYADFGVNIYKSNIIELIEEFPSVQYADINFTPQNSFYQGDYTKSNFLSGLTSAGAVNTDLNAEDQARSVYWKAQALGYTQADSYRIAKIMEDAQNAFIQKYMNWPPEYWPSNQYKDEFTQINTWDKIVHWKRNIFANKINERTFFGGLAKTIYNKVRSGDSVISSDGSRVCDSGTEITTFNPITNRYEYFYQSTLFRQAISNMRKDLLYIIRYNMLDSNGNIAPEYATQELQNQKIKTLIRGGYSLGNEIVQMRMKTEIVYK